MIRYGRFQQASLVKLWILPINTNPIEDKKSNSNNLSFVWNTHQLQS